MTFSQKLVRYMARNNIKAPDIYKVNGPSKQTLYEILNNGADPSYKTIEKIAESLGFTDWKFLKEISKKS